MRIELSASRILNDRWFGFNTPIMWDIPFEDPKAMPLFAGLRPGLFRFPGGLIANHWNWETGRVSVPDTYPGSFRAGSTDAIRHHPQGSSYEDFADFAEAAGAELNLVLNIETATVENQVAWIEHLAERGVHPTRIELGNEMYFAAFMGGADRFPNCEAYLEISKQYIDAIRPLVPANTRFAVQSAGSKSDDFAGPGNMLEEHLANWDAALGEHDFYEATVVHTYPELISLMRPDFSMAAMVGPARASLKGVKRTISELDSEEIAADVMGALLARVEQGTRRQVEFLDAKTGGKEIWYTEWGVGENAAFYRGENPVVTSVWVQVMARHLQSFLRQTSITQVLNHSLYFDGRIWSAMRAVQSEEFYRPTGAYDMFRWFGEALDVAHGEITVHIADVTGASTRDSVYVAAEQYTDVTASVVDASNGKRTAIVQNTSGDVITIELDGIASSAPDVAEMIHSTNLRQTYSWSTPEISPLPVALSVELPSNSLARFVWNA